MPTEAKPKLRRYICALCNTRCVSERPDAEAMAEYEALFGHKVPADAPIVCDVCWQRMKDAGAV